MIYMMCTNDTASVSTSKTNSYFDFKNGWDSTIKQLQGGWCEILSADSPGALHAARMCQQLVYLQAASISSECFSMNRSVPSANEGAKLLVGNITLEDSVGNIMNY